MPQNDLCVQLPTADTGMKFDCMRFMDVSATFMCEGRAEIPRSVSFLAAGVLPVDDFKVRNSLYLTAR